MAFLKFNFKIILIYRLCVIVLLNNQLLQINFESVLNFEHAFFLNGTNNLMNSKIKLVNGKI